MVLLVSTEREIAELLYDYLTGQYSMSDRYHYAPLSDAALLNNDPEIKKINRQLMGTGFELRPAVGDRWGLAQDLARRIKELDGA